MQSSHGETSSATIAESQASRDERSHEEASRDRGIVSDLNLDLPALKQVRAKLPWRASSGSSALLHPLRNEEFWEQYFGRQALVIHHGASAPALLASASLARFSNACGSFHGSRFLGKRCSADALGEFMQNKALEDRLPRRLRRDPLLVALRRLTSSRDMNVSLHRTPPQTVATSEQMLFSDKFVLQVFGSQTWAVCTQGSSPPFVGQQCSQTRLQRGDVLYVPPNTWHRASSMVGASSHLAWQVNPLLATDFVHAVNYVGRGQAVSLPPEFGSLRLPIWGYHHMEDASKVVAEFCSGLPWQRGSYDAAIVCSPLVVSQALRRLSKGARKAGIDKGKVSFETNLRFGPFWRAMVLVFLAPVLMVAFGVAVICCILRDEQFEARNGGAYVRRSTTKRRSVGISTAGRSSAMALRRKKMQRKTKLS